MIDFPVQELYQDVFGDQALDIAYQFSEIERNLQQAVHPQHFHQLIIAFLKAIDSKDPNPFHFEIARKVIMILDYSSLNNEMIIDRLARELLNYCHQLLKQTPLYCKAILNSWGKIYLNLISQTGKTGKEEAKKLLPKLEQTYQENSISFWFIKRNNKSHFFHSPAFLILAAILWKDHVSKWVSFQERNLPAISTSVYHPVRNLLSTHMQVESLDKSIHIIHQDHLIGKINIPSIPMQMASFVFKGVPRLNSVYGHRLFRFEVQEPFRQLVAGNKDYRIIKLDSGFSELAQRLGLKGKKAITILKEIVCAQAYLEFSCQHFSGNFIQLTKFVSPHVSKETGLFITVGTMLLPYQTFEDYRNGNCGLLIPLMHDPPLVGANQYHASQYTLQMDIIAELSKHSIELFKRGCIKITPDRWQALARQAGLPASLLPRIQDRWTQDGEDAPKFLDRMSMHDYTLSHAYDKELSFLKDQGQMRIRGSDAGKKSAVIRQGKW